MNAKQTHNKRQKNEIMKQIYILLFFLIMGFSAQAQTFKGGLAVGGNFAQIDGDRIAGYTKAGLNLGFVSEMVLTESWSLGFEILYAQKGSSTNLFITQRNLPFTFRIKWDYIEVPILVKFDDPRGDLKFGAGISIGRLVRTQYEEAGTDLTDFVFGNNPPNRTDLNVTGEMTYMVSNFFGFNLRMNYSIFRVRQDCANSAYRQCAQFNNLITLRTLFIFSALIDKRP